VLITPVGVFVEVRVRVGVAVLVRVAVDVLVREGVAVFVRVAVRVAVAVGGTDPTVSVPPTGSHVGEPSLSRQPLGIRTIRVLNERFVEPFATPLNVIEKRVPLPETGTSAQGVRMVSRPGRLVTWTKLQPWVSAPWATPFAGTDVTAGS
jgi:hypothetical protein